MKKGQFWHSATLMAAVVAVTVSFSAMSAHATEQKDLAVGLKTLPLLTNKLSGTAVAAVVFDPANPASKSDADAIKAALDGGMKAGDVAISGVLVPVSDLSKLASAKIAFVAQGTSSSFDKIASAASSNGVLTISTDLDCVKGGKCVLGVVSSPSVEIYYNKAAGDAAKVTFSPAFTMLVKQI